MVIWVAPGGSRTSFGPVGPSGDAGAGRLQTEVLQPPLWLLDTLLALDQPPSRLDGGVLLPPPRLAGPVGGLRNRQSAVLLGFSGSAHPPRSRTQQEQRLLGEVAWAVCAAHCPHISTFRPSQALPTREGCPQHRQTSDSRFPCEAAAGAGHLGHAPLPCGLHPSQGETSFVNI